MTVKLKQEDFRRLVQILQAHPDFKSARDRRKLVEGELEGAPRADSILAGLDLEGAPRVAAVEVVKSLADFGQVAYGKEALGVLLNYLQGITCGWRIPSSYYEFATHTAADEQKAASKRKKID